jgi:hypothetical protein
MGEEALPQISPRHRFDLHTPRLGLVPQLKLPATTSQRIRELAREAVERNERWGADGKPIAATDQHPDSHVVVL